jgi:DNA-binding LacI/PurR family transcriptional regulator
MTPRRPRYRRVTSREVAARAGVSRTTVSMVLNDPHVPSIGEETRARVLEAAAQLGYTPNSAARVLVSGRTDTIGLVLSQPELLAIDGFVPQLVLGISQVAERLGYRMLFETVRDASHSGAYLELVGGKRIDGLIVVNPKVEDTGLVQLVESGFPVVLVGTVKHPREYSVNFHTGTAVRQLITHLASLGHERIAHVALSPPGPVATNARLSGFRHGIKDAGLPFDEELVAHGDYSAESGQLAAARLLDEGKRFTALFAANDTLALGAMRALREHDLRIPEDVAVVGFDDLPFSAFTDPPLTTVRNPGVAQGQLAAQKLVALLQHEPVAERVSFLETELVVRESCGARLAAGRRGPAAAARARAKAKAKAKAT